MNTLTGLYKLTSANPRYPEPDPLFPPEQFDRFLGVITFRQDLPFFQRRAVAKGIDPYSGKALFSALLPAGFDYNQRGIEIVDGILVKGKITDRHMGTAHRSIMQEIRKNTRFGPDRAAELLTDAPYLARVYLDTYGFTIGITDCNPKSEKIRKAIDIKVAQSRIAYNQVLRQPAHSDVEKEYKENQLNAALQGIGGIGQEIAEKEYSEYNAIRIMAKKLGAGAKGSDNNIRQLSAVIGQQYIFGKRPESKVSGGTRVMCTFDAGDESMEAHGCVLNSFSSGLNPSEYFFHAMSSRQGLLDTATKTSETGAFHNKISKTIESVIVAYDGTVRDYLNHIVQFTYGNDGLNAAELISVPTKTSQNLATFIDLELTAAHLNVERGWAPKETNQNILKSRKNLLRSLRQQRKAKN
jgi:DNA-directed RNA polymerase beta' subunit